VSISYLSAIHPAVIRRPSTKRAAQIGICIQFLALIRALAEFHRLRYVAGPPLTLDMAAFFVTGALITAICILAAVIAYFIESYRTVIAIAAVTIVILLVYKAVVMP
jgi:hypothetical protein